jgi:hypothetical protein
MNDIETTIKALNKKGFKAVYAKDAKEALDRVLSVVGRNESIGVGGSVTMQETGIVDALIERGNTVYWHWLAWNKGQDADETRKKAMSADVYLSSTNAVTTAGDLINIDGTGNRAASMFYGPNKVIIVAGRNKISSNPHTAVARIKRVACPKNARRIGLDTPCAKTGKCEECNGTSRMCNVTIRIQYPTNGKEIHVVLIDGDFGY